jgi:hypothetical protein
MAWPIDKRAEDMAKEQKDQEIQRKHAEKEADKKK